MLASDFLAFVARVSGLTAREQDVLARSYSLLSPPERAESLARAKEIARRADIHAHYRADMAAAYHYAAHLLALAAMQREANATRIKRSLRPGAAERLAERRVAGAAGKRRGRGAPKRAIVAQHLQLIAGLLAGENGPALHWREVAEYLARHHRVQISHASLRTHFLALTGLAPVAAPGGEASTPAEPAPYLLLSGIEFPGQGGPE